MGGLPRRGVCEMWRYLGRLPGGGSSPVGAHVQQLLLTSPERKWCPPLLHDFHWLFLLPSVLWSEQDLTSAASAFCGFFLGKSISSANGCMGCLPRLSSPLDLCHPEWTLTCRQFPHLTVTSLGSQQLPQDECQGRGNQRESGPELLGCHCSDLWRGFNELVVLRENAF